MFKFWSEYNKQAKSYLSPDLGLRSWNELDGSEKDKIWHHLNWFFFNVIDRRSYDEYEFCGGYPDEDYKKKTIVESISYLNEGFKAKSFGISYLKNQTLDSACSDFYRILMEEDENVVMELLSAYVKFLYQNTKNDNYVYKSEKESQDDFLKRKETNEFKYFDFFSKRINDIFLQFGIKYCLTRNGFIPRQEEKIMEEIYEPTLKSLSDIKWKKVNELLSDSFTDYKENTPQGYSGCVTKTISAIEAFMQILVDGKNNNKKLSLLITQAQKQKIIPSDYFTSIIFKNIDSILSQERMATGDGHPKKEYASEKNARMILNLAMIFIQHCIY